MTDHSLSLWLRDDEFADLMQGTGLLPDAYLRMPRAGRDKGASFFLEVQRGGKTDEGWVEKSL